MVFENEEGFSIKLGFIIEKSGPHLGRSFMKDEFFAYLSYEESILIETISNPSSISTISINPHQRTEHWQLTSGSGVRFAEKPSPVTAGLKYFFKHENEAPELAALLWFYRRI